MANEISLVTASGSTVTPKDDGIIYEVFSPGNGIIYGGAVTIKDSSTLHITAGHGIVCGRKFTIDDSDIPVALSGSGSLLGRLYIHLDLADAADPITLLVETGASLTPVVQDSDVNINNGVFEINLATFDVDTITISNLVDVAPYLNTNGYEHEQMNNALGNTDISGIGDGSVTGAISTLNAGKVNTSAIANNLTTTSAGYVLDARQGKALNDNIALEDKTSIIGINTVNFTDSGSTLYKQGRMYLFAFNFTVKVAFGKDNPRQVFTFTGLDHSKIKGALGICNLLTNDASSKGTVRIYGNSSGLYFMTNVAATVNDIIQGQIMFVLLN